MRTLSLFILGSIFITSTASAQIGGNAVYANTQHTANTGVDLGLPQPYGYNFSNGLEANVMVNVKAVAYVAIFSITQHGATVEETETAMAARTALLKSSLQTVGIAEAQVFIDPVSLVPEYEFDVAQKKFSKTLTEVPAGFEMKKNVHVTFKGHDKINAIISAAARAEVYDLVKVDYTIENMDAVLAGLRESALAILMNKKAAIEKAGLTLRFTQVGESYGSAYPVERYAQYTAYKTGIAPRFAVTYKKGVPQQQVQYNYAEKNKTIYYDKVSDKQFDLIVNPVVGEPQVQIYLSLKAQYERYNSESEAADKAYQKRMREIELAERELALEAKRKDLGLAKKDR